MSRLVTALLAALLLLTGWHRAQDTAPLAASRVALVPEAATLLAVVPGDDDKDDEKEEDDEEDRRAARA
jgi:hypothetical protein